MAVPTKAAQRPEPVHIGRQAQVEAARAAEPTEALAALREVQEVQDLLPDQALDHLQVVETKSKIRINLL